MTPKHDAFIAYSHRNRTFVDRLVADLREHHIEVWCDTLEIKVGEQFRQRIEDGIDGSRFFCFVLSNASLKSYFARRIELETAFAKMIEERRTDFILPLRLTCDRPIPRLLSTFQYLDFSSAKSYMTSLKKLVKRLSLSDENFTGSRLYKNVDTSMAGTMVGVGLPLKQAPYRGTYVRVFFDNGRITSMETFTDGKPDGAKGVIYDARGRVREIVLFRGNRVVDTWRYEYDTKTKLRKYKWVCLPGEHPHQRLTYDRQGNKTSEAHVAADGTLRAGDERWSEKRYVRDDTGEIVAYEYFDTAGRRMRTERVH